MLRKLLVLIPVALATAPSALAAAGGCHAISGTYVNHNVACPVVALSCVETDIAGDLAGTSFTTVTGFDPATHTFYGTVVTTLENGAVTSNTIVGTIVGGVGTYSGVYCLGLGAGENG